MEILIDKIFEGVESGVDFKKGVDFFADYIGFIFKEKEFGSVGRIKLIKKQGLD